MAAPGLPEAVAFEFRTQHGGMNYGDCAGVYHLSEADSLLNGRPVYVCEETENFLGFNGSNWVLTGLAQMERLIQTQKKGFKGFHIGGSGEPDDAEWGQYVVLRRACVSLSPEPEALVLIQGLVSAQDLNGQRGSCLQLDAASGRWAVQLPAGEVRLVKAENLLVIGRHQPEPQTQPASFTTPEDAAPKAPPLLSPATPAPAPQSGKPPSAAPQAQTTQRAPHKPSQAPPSVAPAPEANEAADEAQELREELSELRKAKALAVENEDFQFARELREAELEAEAKLQAAMSRSGLPGTKTPSHVSPPQKQERAERVGEALSRPQLRDETSAQRAGKAAEVARLYEERAALAQEEAGEAQEQAGRAGLTQRIQEAEAEALPALLAEVADLRQELEATRQLRRQAWRAEEEDRAAELARLCSRLETKLGRLEAAAQHAQEAAESLQPQHRRTERAGASGGSLARKLQGATQGGSDSCAACGAVAESRKSPDGLRYCAWCWSWWDGSQKPSTVAAPAPREPKAFRGGCFWDLHRDDASGQGEAAGLQRPAPSMTVQHGAIANGGALRLLAAGLAIEEGPIITEERAAAIGWEARGRLHESLEDLVEDEEGDGQVGG